MHRGSCWRWTPAGDQTGVAHETFHFWLLTIDSTRNSPANGDTRAVITNAAGEFTLNSFNMQRVIDAPTGGNTVPEPGSLALLAASLLRLAGTRRLMRALY